MEILIIGVLGALAGYYMFLEKDDEE